LSAVVAATVAFRRLNHSLVVGFVMRVSDLSVGLLAYFVGVERVYVVLVDQQGRLQRFDLMRCVDAYQLIDRLVDVLEQPYAWTETQREHIVAEFCSGWGKALLPPAAAIGELDVLQIVPHHFLHGVPLHLVHGTDGPLATTHGVAYCSSITLFERCVDRNLARQFDAAHWTFPVGDDRSPAAGPPIRSCLSCGVDVLTGKDASYIELARAFSAQFAESAEARNRFEVKAAIDCMQTRIQSANRRPDAICLVCHGYHDALRPDRSGLLLANDAGLINMRNVRVHRDRILRVQDHPFVDMPLRLDPVLPHAAILSTGELKVHCQTDAQLVALFGCSTGAGVGVSNDDLDSHAYQWLKAGAASVVANLWEADFSLITRWTHQFVANWVVRRQPKAIAAREANRTILNELPTLAKQPSVWGSVCVLGDWL
jgi:CHAT domain-containing protein